MLIIVTGAALMPCCQSVVKARTSHEWQRPFAAVSPILSTVFLDFLFAVDGMQAHK